MELDTACIECLVHRYALIGRENGDEQTATAFLREILAAVVAAPRGVAVPYLTPEFARITEKYYGATDYPALKAASNALMAELLPSLRETVQGAADPLMAALTLARTCNYLDYTALRGRVNRAELLELLQRQEDLGAEYERLLQDLSAARKLVYICDNAGEVYADALAGEELKKRFPSLELLFAVRGKPAVNDALREDAQLAGLDRLGRILDSGSGSSGTEISALSEEMKQEVLAADVILAKGQGNFETMCGCGLNVYYMFLCKCPRFTRLFSVPLLQGLLVNERRMKKSE